MIYQWWLCSYDRNCLKSVLFAHILLSVQFYRIKVYHKMNSCSLHIIWLFNRLASRFIFSLSFHHYFFKRPYEINILLWSSALFSRFAQGKRTICFDDMMQQLFSLLSLRTNIYSSELSILLFTKSVQAIYW